MATRSEDSLDTASTEVMEIIPARDVLILVLPAVLILRVGEGFLELLLSGGVSLEVLDDFLCAVVRAMGIVLCGIFGGVVFSGIVGGVVFCGGSVGDVAVFFAGEDVGSDVLACLIPLTLIPLDLIP